MIEIYCDGASKGNPGPASIGVSILRAKVEIATISERIGIATNNVAEWTSLLKALEYIISSSEEEISIYMDSELVVKQFLGEYKTKNPSLIPLKEKVLELIKSFKSIQIQHVRREFNKRADELANSALKK